MLLWFGFSLFKNTSNENPMFTWGGSNYKPCCTILHLRELQLWLIQEHGAPILKGYKSRLGTISREVTEIGKDTNF